MFYCLQLVLLFYCIIIKVSLQEIRKSQHAPKWYVGLGRTHNRSPQCGCFQWWIDAGGQWWHIDHLLTCPFFCQQRLLLMPLTRLAQPGLQLSVTEPDYIRAITAKVSWTLGVNQWPPRGQVRGGGGWAGRASCLVYAWKPIGFVCLSGHMDPDGIMSDSALIHIILPSNQYWDSTSHSEGSPNRKRLIYPPSRIFSSECCQLWLQLYSCGDCFLEIRDKKNPEADFLLLLQTYNIYTLSFCVWHISVIYLFKTLSHCVCLTSVYFKKCRRDSILVYETATCCVMQAKRVIWMWSA